MTRLIARLRSLWRGLHRRPDIEADMTEEFRHHIELRTEDLLRRGLPRAEARRQAHIEFGHIEGHREDARASRGLRFFDQLRFSWLDVTLAVRILVRQPGLTLVAVFALAIGIPVGLLQLHVLDSLTTPAPVEDGLDIVSITVLTTLNMPAVAPIASASVMTAAARKPGVRSRARQACFRSRMASSTDAKR